jgi:hypothetical protein
MFAPVIKKLMERQSLFVERSLSEEGNITVSVGEIVRPFDKLGHCTVSRRKLLLPEKFNPTGFKPNAKDASQFIYAGTVLGKDGKETIAAPYDGFLTKTETSQFIFEEEARPHNLLSGVWGSVEKVLEGKSALISTNVVDVGLVVSTQGSFVGELVVFPDQKNFFEKYFVSAVASKPEGKVIYVGDYVDLEKISRISSAGVGAVIAGGGKREVLTYAKSIGMNLGFVSGFGEVKTSKEVFKRLSKHSERLVFFHGDKRLLRIPLSPEEVSPRKKRSIKCIKPVKKNANVLTMQGVYFGYIGKVDSVKDSSILVRFDGVKDLVEVYSPNFLLLE